MTAGDVFVPVFLGLLPLALALIVALPTTHPHPFAEGLIAGFLLSITAALWIYAAANVCRLAERCRK